MVGKIILAVLGIVLLALLVLLLIPLNIRASYENGVFSAWLSYMSKKIVLFPCTEKEDQPKEEPVSDRETVRKPKEKKNFNWEQISYSLDVLPRVLVRALRRTGRRVTVLPLKFHLLVALNDPADTAVLYGKLQGILAAMLPLLHRAVRIRKQDIQLFPDFCGGQMDVIADIGIRIRPFDILIVALSAAFGIIKWYFGVKKRADRTDAVQVKIKKATAAANTAAESRSK